MYELLLDGLSFTPAVTNTTGVFNERLTEVGVYTVLVTDENTCVSDPSNPVDIQAPVMPSLSNVTVNRMLCVDGDPGSFQVGFDNVATISAGAETIGFTVYNFDASQPNNMGLMDRIILAPPGGLLVGNTATIANIGPGRYIIEARDGFGCSDTIEAVMPETTRIEPDFILDEGVSCDTTTAQYTISATGGAPTDLGTGDYTFQQVTEDGTPIGASIGGQTASFSVNDQVFFTVTDGNGCSVP